MHSSEEKFSLRFTPFDRQFSDWTADLLSRVYAGAVRGVRLPAAPDREHFLTAVFLFEADAVLGRAVLYHNPGIAIGGLPTLLIGGYEAVHDEAVADALLTAVENYAVENDFGCLLGPMDGSTWADYRFITSPQEQPFFTEPLQQFYYAESWRQLGFTEASTYHSGIAGLPPAGPPPDEVRRRLEADGITVRPISLENMAEELRRLYPLVSGAFSHSPYYTVISEADFVGKFLRLQTLLDADCTLIATAGGRPVGFVLCLPDYGNAPGQTLVLKTIARSPGFAHATLIPQLGELLYRTAAGKGYRRIIHAFMQSGNRSRIRSSQFGGMELRRYALLEKRLGG